MPADHLDDDVISDAIDGVDPPAPAAEHLASCPPCQARLARFAEASRLVAAPVRPLDPSTVDALVDRALAAPVVSIDELRERRRLLRAVPPPWAVAVAAAIALVIGIPALLRVSGTSTNTDSSARSADSTSGAALSGGSTGGVAASGGGAGGGSANSTLGDHLGVLDSDAAVVASLRSRLDVAHPEAPVLAKPTAGGADEAASQPVARGSQSKAPVRDGELEDAAGPSVPVCKNEATATARGVSAGAEPIYYAPATWQRQAVIVFVFTLAQPADDGLRRQAYVIAVRGCAVVASPRF